MKKSFIMPLVIGILIGFLVTLSFNCKDRAQAEAKGFQFGRDSLKLTLNVKWTAIDSANLPKVHSGNPPTQSIQSDSTSTESTEPTNECYNNPSNCMTLEASHRPPVSIMDPRFFILKGDKFIRVQPTYYWKIFTIAAIQNEVKQSF